MEKAESGAEWVEKVESRASGRSGRRDQVGEWSQRRVGREGRRSGGGVAGDDGRVKKAESEANGRRRRSRDPVR